MNKCPADNCGRTFETASILQEHIKRRHPKYFAESTSTQRLQREEEKIIQEEQISRLPKIKQLRMQSQQHKGVNVYRKSLSKNKQDPKNIQNVSKITTVIADSRAYLETTQESEKKSKRQSLHKKGNSSDLGNAKQDRLPELKTVRQKKLQLLAGHGSKINKAASYQERDPMAMTAPSFSRLERKEVLQKSKSKEKVNPDSSYFEDESHIKKVHAEKMVMIKTQQGFHEKEAKLHHARPFLRRASDREKKIQKMQASSAEHYAEQKLQEQVGSPANEINKEYQIKRQVVSPATIKKELQVQRQAAYPVADLQEEEQLRRQTVSPADKVKMEEKIKRQAVVPATSSKKGSQIKKQAKFKHALKRETSLRKSQPKLESCENINLEQRIVVLKQTASSRLSLPSNGKCEFIYANNCNLNSINLSNLQTLREISLQHNNLRQLSFLNYSCNYNIEKIFIDHNQLITLDYLPPNLKVISATFNAIEGLENNSRELSALISLQQIDLTFNPIRKEPNYKLHIISSCQTLKKIDGIKITKFDLQLAAQYSRLLDEELGLIPSNKFRNLVVSQCPGSPSTVISTEYEQEPQQSGMTYEQLEKEIAKLSKITKQTQQNLSIIKQQNEIISHEIQELKGKEEDVSFDSGALYEKLKAECEALELLNFLKYASEQELQQLIMKKQNQLIMA